MEEEWPVRRRAPYKQRGDALAGGGGRVAPPSTVSKDGNPRPQPYPSPLPEIRCSALRLSRALPRTSQGSHANGTRGRIRYVCLCSPCTSHTAVCPRIKCVPREHVVRRFSRRNDVIEAAIESAQASRRQTPRETPLSEGASVWSTTGNATWTIAAQNLK
jgi:hypothetical protein